MYNKFPTIPSLEKLVEKQKEKNKIKSACLTFDDE